MFQLRDTARCSSLAQNFTFLLVALHSFGLVALREMVFAFQYSLQHFHSLDLIKCKCWNLLEPLILPALDSQCYGEISTKKRRICISTISMIHKWNFKNSFHFPLPDNFKHFVNSDFAIEKRQKRSNSRELVNCFFFFIIYFPFKIAALKFVGN